MPYFVEGGDNNRNNITPVATIIEAIEHLKKNLGSIAGRIKVKLEIYGHCFWSRRQSGHGVTGLQREKCWNGIGGLLMTNQGNYVND